MARHANDKNTFAIAGWLIAVIVLAVLMVLALLLYLLTGNNENNDNDDNGDGTDTTAQETTAVESLAPTPPSAAPSPSTSSAAAAERKAPSAPESTLFLLDTSAGMAPYFAAAADGVAAAADGVGGDGKAVSLWNYSSPISASATVGYRQNLGFTDGRDTAGVVNNFGTGGVPQTRSAIVAAADNAADYARESSAPVRVVLITTGTDELLSDEEFFAQLGTVKDSAVEISVVHLGDGEVDTPLKDAADYFEKIDRANDGPAVSAAICAAVGIG